MNNACKAILFEGMFLVGNGFSKEAGKVVEKRCIYIKDRSQHRDQQHAIRPQQEGVREGISCE